MKTPKKKYNSKSLIEACYQLVLRPDTTIRLVNLTANEEANSVFNLEGPICLKIKADIDKSGLIRSIFHETLHCQLSPLMEPFNWRLEEDIIRRLEDALWVRCFDKKEVTRWRRAINKKLGVNDDTG